MRTDTSGQRCTACSDVSLRTCRRDTNFFPDELSFFFLFFYRCIYNITVLVINGKFKKMLLLA